MMQHFAPQPSVHEDSWVNTASFLREDRKEQRLASLELRLSWGLGSAPRTFTVGLTTQRNSLWLVGSSESLKSPPSSTGYPFLPTETR